MHRRAPFFLFALVSAGGCLPDSDGIDGLVLESTGEVVEGEFIIAADLSNKELETLGLEPLDFNDPLGLGLYLADEGVTRDALQRALGNHSKGGPIVEANRPTRLAANDPYRGYQWNMDMLDIESAWTSTQGSGVTVAVIDSGVSFSGEDAPAYPAGGWDFVDNDGDARDENGHGTHVAGTIAQASNNGRGVIGMAPNARIMALRVLGADGYGNTWWTVQAITHAADNGADVINMSLGSAYTTSAESDAIAYAQDRDVVIVAASGNEGQSQVSYPARHDGVIAVGSVGASKQVPAYSNRGTGLDIVAPGGDMGRDDDGDGYADGILQETGGSYQFFEGTSMASPHVAGAAALLLAAGASADEVPDLLYSTAEDLGGAGWSSHSGWGLLDINAALDAIGSGGGGTTDPDPDQEEPEVDTTAPVISGIGGERNGSSLTLWWDTDEASTSQVEFEGYGRYGDTELVAHHEVRFTVQAAATYRFRVISADASGNESVGAWWTTSP